MSCLIDVGTLEQLEPTLSLAQRRTPQVLSIVCVTRGFVGDAESEGTTFQPFQRSNWAEKFQSALARCPWKTDVSTSGSSWNWLQWTSARSIPHPLGGSPFPHRQDPVPQLDPDLCELSSEMRPLAGDSPMSRSGE